MILLTKEQRERAVQKAKETRQKNKSQKIAIEEAKIQEALDYQYGITELKREFDLMTQKLDSLKKEFELVEQIKALTDLDFHSEQEIIEKSVKFEDLAGVYFLIKDNRVVYVGQSVNVFARLQQHVIKNFDRFAYIKCKPSELDVIESIYIHIYQPEQNGKWSHGGMHAPLTFKQCLNMNLCSTNL